MKPQVVQEVKQATQNNMEPMNYQDGFSSPRLLDISGNPLPNPRAISLAISQPTPIQRLSNTIDNYKWFLLKFKP